MESSRFCDQCGRDDNKNGGRVGLRCRKKFELFFGTIGEDDVW